MVMVIEAYAARGARQTAVAPAAVVISRHAPEIGQRRWSASLANGTRLRASSGASASLLFPEEGDGPATCRQERGHGCAGRDLRGRCGAARRVGFS